ncbi:MAG: leucine-rich repeat protein [Bacteroidales bacterium]|nr:leucine-rich repeat protein [Bacteroidales bacterium]
METPPPIPQEQPKAQPEQVIDPLFLKSENEILNGLIERECEKVGFDIKRDSLNHFEKKKLTATLISAPINLIIIILFRTFHYADWVAVFLILINFLIWRKFQKSDVNTFLVKEIKLRQREKFSDVIAPQLFEKCKNQKWLRIAILAAFTFVIPIIMFFKPHIFYEDAPDGKYVRFYTEGLTGSEELVIPETVDGVTVKGIRGDVFRNTSLERVTLPNTIDTIRGHAFEGCSQLQSINIPTNVKSIGAYAFSECENLLYVEFPESLKHIGAYAFNHCEQLSINNLPQQMDSIGAYAFQSCWKIKELTLPDNLTEIHAFCFSGTRITSITIPASVERIGEQAFSNTDLETLIFEDNSQLTRIGSRAFFFTKLTEVTIPPSVKEIRGSAFRECHNLTKATIPQDCEVADKAFKASPTEIERY